MKTSAAGVAAIAFYEGLRTTAYRDSVGVWTIGVGHTAAAGPPKPAAGMTITHQQALDILATDLPKYEVGVNRRLPDVSQHVFDAAVSFHFNTGAIASASWPSRYRSGDMAGAEAALKQWNKAKGAVIPGLTTRRAEEADMIFRNTYPNHIASPDFVGGRKPDIPDDEMPPPDLIPVATLETVLMPASVPVPAAAPSPSPIDAIMHLVGSIGLNSIMQANPATAIVGALVKGALDKENVQIETKDVPAAATEVLAAIKADPKVAVVQTKSAWLSKINWTQAAGLIATVGAIVGLPLTSGQILAVVTGIQTVVAIGTWIMKTFFSSTVTPASVGK